MLELKKDLGSSELGGTKVAVIFFAHECHNQKRGDQHNS